MFKSFCAIFYLIINTYGSDMEPKCYSRFDYDEKMLLKLLRIEDQIKKFEDHLKEMKETLNAEKSNRMESFANEMGEFRERNLEEVQRQQNLTEKFNESLNRTETTLNESLQHQESLIKEVIDNVNKTMETYEKFIKEMLNAEKTKRTEAFATEMEEFRERNLEEIQRQRKLTKRIRASQKRANTTMSESLKHQQNMVKEVIDKVNERLDTYKKFTKDEDVVFTVTGPDDGRTAGSLTFKNVITNEGDGYDISTGIFTCPTRGLYYFSLHLMKRYGSYQDQVGCYIKMNGTETVRAHFNPEDYDGGDGYGSYDVSTSVYVRLEVGSLVMVAGCYGYRGASSSIEPWSSFSGHLIRSYF
ncbi:uncharacterized protein LOC123533158 [Mercenaria mercenaria]|uniref:uncharacterized protein LOC123533158 n=1 Tax=Mercenaria mercenaria TaxID=6596 RepID=UPI00234E81E4|nr:uncharacterized protein LOC123533158 [Mercenaria mercenaria]